MSTTATSADVAPERVRPLRRSEYEALVAAGRFVDERIELLRGALVEMSPQNPRHAAVTQRLDRLLTLALHDRAVVRVQMPLALADDSEPEPNVAVVARGDHDGAHPDTALLVIEVADASLRKDRGLKAALYATAGIPELWVVNLVDDRIELHLEPMGDSYTRTLLCGPGKRIAPQAFPDVELAVDEILRNLD